MLERPSVKRHARSLPEMQHEESPAGFCWVCLSVVKPSVASAVSSLSLFHPTSPSTVLCPQPHTLPPLNKKIQKETLSLLSLQSSLMSSAIVLNTLHPLDAV